jgi:hypothetical protein
MVSIINERSIENGSQLDEFVWARAACTGGAFLDSELAARLATAVRPKLPASSRQMANRTVSIVRWLNCGAYTYFL